MLVAISDNSSLLETKLARKLCFLSIRDETLLVAIAQYFVSDREMNFDTKVHLFRDEKVFVAISQYSSLIETIIDTNTFSFLSVTNYLACHSRKLSSLLETNLETKPFLFLLETKRFWLTLATKMYVTSIVAIMYFLAVLNDMEHVPYALDNLFA